MLTRDDAIKIAAGIANPLGWDVTAYSPNSRRIKFEPPPKNGMAWTFVIDCDNKVEDVASFKHRCITVFNLVKSTLSL